MRMMIGVSRWWNDSHHTPVCQSVCQRLGGRFNDDDGPPLSGSQLWLSGPVRPHFATKPRAELASIDRTQHIWLGLRALSTHLTKRPAGHDGADCGDLLSPLVTKHNQSASMPAADKNKARLMEFKWWYGGHCRLQNIFQSPISNI